jgi:predicted nucleic acid-binding protein
LPARSSRYLLDNTVFIAAVKRKWTRSTELIYHLLDSPAELFANDLLVHAATCLYADAILITNDNHFNKIKNDGLVEVWSNTKAIKRLLDGIDDFEDS